MPFESPNSIAILKEINDVEKKLSCGVEFIYKDVMKF